MFLLFAASEEYYCSEDDLFEIYTLQDKRIVTIFIKALVDLIIFVHMAIFCFFFGLV